MTDQQLTDRIAKLERTHPAEAGCRVEELLNILRDLQQTRHDRDILAAKFEYAKQVRRNQRDLFMRKLQQARAQLQPA